MSKRNSDEQEEYKLEDYINVYLENRNNRDELEIRFATKTNYNPLKKITFDKKVINEDVNIVLIGKNGGFVKKISIRDLKSILYQIK